MNFQEKYHRQLLCLSEENQKKEKVLSDTLKNPINLNPKTNTHNNKKADFYFPN
jgi:hypothetical protein